MEPDIQRGEEFMKQITKAALSALFRIGVTSSENIDKFIEYFSEELMKNYPVVPSEPKTEPEPPKSSPAEAPKTAQKETTDVSTIVKDEEVLKILRATGLDTIEKLSLEMQKKSLTEINGITGVIEDQIREALKEWNKS